jgi:5-methylcytosine-specific restriction endonuclease McrA
MAKTSDEIRAYNAAYYLKYRDQIRARVKKARLENPDVVQERKRLDYEKNKETRKATMRAYYAANREKCIFRAAEWANANPQKMAICKKNWERNNPERRRTACHIRRARIRGAGGKHTTAEWIQLVEASGSKCLKCQMPGNYRTLHRDHVIPASKGGSSDITNIQPLCVSCNSGKGNKTEDFRSR